MNATATAYNPARGVIARAEGKAEGSAYILAMNQAIDKLETELGRLGEKGEAWHSIEVVVNR